MTDVSRAPGRENAADDRPTIGVLGIQGDVSEHIAALTRTGARARWVKRPEDLEGIAGLVLPGGESTTLRRLLDYEGLLAKIR
ncbi:MAG: pyridoxal 5'-phosphate synthase glutaminase subunit PdxT, partial [Gemmatimonadota bacterium]